MLHLRYNASTEATEEANNKRYDNQGITLVSGLFFIPKILLHSPPCSPTQLHGLDESMDVFMRSCV